MRHILRSSAVLMFAAFAACEQLPSAPAAVATPDDGPSFYTSATTVCASQPIPAGYVILSYSNNPNCQFWAPGAQNQLTRAIPGSTEVVCATSPTPTGYVHVAAGNSASCLYWSPGTKNTTTITIPGYTQVVCSTSPIPSNYYVTGYGNSTACAYWAPGGQNTKTIQRI